MVNRGVYSKMAKIMISKQFSFDAAHRLIDSYTTACQNLHGHTYHVQLFLSEDERIVDETGVVADFTYVKEVFQEQIEDRLDHKTILHSNDELVNSIPKKTLFIVDWIPTVENISRYIYNQLISKFGAPAKTANLVSVRVYESPTSWAQYPELLTDSETTSC